MTRPSPLDFIEPNWQAPIDVGGVLSAIPESSTITGMFLEPAAREARARGRPLASARERYVPFRFYPLREHARLLVEACAALFPQLALRMALRKLGRAGPNAYLASTLGRVSISSAQTTYDCIVRMASSYSINVPGTQAETSELDAHNAIVSFRKLHYFADCHHVGVFEGVLRYAGAHGNVKLRALSPHDVDLWCSWD